MQSISLTLNRIARYIQRVSVKCDMQNFSPTTFNKAHSPDGEQVNAHRSAAKSAELKDQTQLL